MQLRTLRFFALLIAGATAWFAGAAMFTATGSRAIAGGVAFAVLLAIALQWLALSSWVRMRRGALAELTARARRIVSGDLERPHLEHDFDEELTEHERLLEDLRSILLQHRRIVEERRAAMAEIVDSIGEGLLALSPSGKVVVANRRLAAMFDCVDDPTGRSVLEVVRKSSVADAIDRALEGVASTERVIIGAAENERQIELRAFPVERSAEIAAVALFIDVTAITRLQRIRQDFIDDFSHEIRTPLAGLRSAAETLEQSGLSAADELQLRLVMQRQIRRLEGLIHDLAELNHIESGQIVLHRETIDLRSLLEVLCSELGGAQFELRGDPLMAHVDAGRVQQVFTNILDNAIRHGGTEGPILVETERDETSSEAVVRVSDNGPGIPAHELERIFHRFYRVDRSRSQPGTGLGLAIAKHLVLAHGGRIRALNRKSGGTTLEVRLPVTPLRSDSRIR